MTTDHPNDLSGMTIGFIGLGLMGQPMATNLHQAGAALVIPRRASDAVADLGDDRVEVLETPAEIGPKNRKLLLKGMQVVER